MWGVMKKQGHVVLCRFLVSGSSAVCILHEIDLTAVFGGELTKEQISQLIEAQSRAYRPHNEAPDWRHQVRRGVLEEVLDEASDS